MPAKLRSELQAIMEAAGLPVPESEERWTAAEKALVGVWASKYNDRAYYSMRKVCPEECCNTHILGSNAFVFGQHVAAMSANASLLLRYGCGMQCVRCVAVLAFAMPCMCMPLPERCHSRACCCSSMLWERYMPARGV